MKSLFTLSVYVGSDALDAEKRIEVLFIFLFHFR